MLVFRLQDIVKVFCVLIYNIVKSLTSDHLENKRRQFWFCCHMLSGNGQAIHICIVVDTGLSNAFDLIYGSKFGEDISKYL